MLELTFLVISIDLKEKKYLSETENLIKFWAHIFGDTLDHQGYFRLKTSKKWCFLYIHEEKL